MSVVPNAVYANPTTPCWDPIGSGSGTSTFPNGILIGTPGNTSAIAPDGAFVMKLNSQIRVGQGAGFANAILDATALSFQQTPSGTTKPFVNFDNVNGVMDLVNVDSINGNPAFAPTYGSFSSTQTQAPLALTATPLVYDTADVVSSGMSVTLPSANITLTAAGTYKVVTSLQCDNTVVGSQVLDMWCEVNGTAVPNSGSRVAINQNQETLMTVEWFLTVPASAVLSVVVYAPVAGPQALAVPAAPPVPAIPSIITTVVRIA